MSSKPKHLLSFTAGPEGDEVTIHGDREGLERLRTALDALIKGLDEGACEHDHLMSPTCAGNELTETMLGLERQAGHKTVHHVKLYAWTAEWRGQHGL